MLGRFKEFLSPDVIGQPRDWELMVARNYEFLNEELRRTEEVRSLENFQADLRAQRIKSRIGGLRDAVIQAKIAEDPNTKYPSGFSIKPYSLCIYMPILNELKGAIERKRPIVEFGLSSLIPVFPEYDVFTVDEKVWCFDKEIVDQVAKGLINLLPPKSSKRILAKAA